MRSFDECKAEVFRRSETRIKQRKKMVTRVVAMCVPLVLCLGVGLWVFAHGIFAGTNNAAAPESAPGMEDALNGYGIPWPESANASTSHWHTESVTVYIDGTGYVLTGEDMTILRDILSNLEYSPHRVCRCKPQYTVATPDGQYGIHLTEGYARCEKGQAKLTKEQLTAITEIINRIKNS